MAQTEPVISVRGLSKGFGDGDVLADIDFEVQSDEITLLMGPNGVGKTILLSCIAGGLHADEGQVTVMGDEPANAKNALSLMLQGGMLVDELTGAENIAFFRDLHPNSTEQFTQILEDLEFDLDELEREAGDYSGGMKRKLELAISLSVDVPLYLLDEPTAALDMTTIDRLHAMLADRREEGDTILMSSHLPTDADLADRIAFVTEGGVSATGTPEELLADVPEVVLVEGTADISETVQDGRLFEGEVYRRGFLRDDVAADELTETGDGTTVEVREPTYTDLFNYYVHIEDTQ